MRYSVLKIKLILTLYILYDNKGLSYNTLNIELIECKFKFKFFSTLKTIIKQ